MTSFRDAIEFLRSRIRLSSPQLDTSPASPIRVVLDAVAELHAQADLAEDKAYDWDLAKKSGKDLDDFVGLFGFSRVPTTHAAGFVTVTFAANTTRDYIIDAGTSVLAFRPGNRRIEYEVSRRTAIPRYSSFATLQVMAKEPGASSNARPGELTFLDHDMDSFIMVKNDEPVSGGRGAETDDELRNRFRADLFRNVLGSEAYYRSVAFRHPRVASAQLIRPFSETEEYLKVTNRRVECQEDSLIYTYPNNFFVYLPRKDRWLQESQDFIVTVDNDTPNPPVINFQGTEVVEGDNVTVRYSYCSNKSRNHPQSNTYHFLDLYVLGRQPMPISDLASFPSGNLFGNGSVTRATHPEGVPGTPYYIFTRQPVVKLHPEFEVNGRRYYEGRDYRLVKDRSLNEGSTRARDILIWKTSLPPTGVSPETFHIPYFCEGVVEELQAVMDDPSVISATDDVLVHSSSEIPFDINLIVEWEKGVEDIDGVRQAIANHLVTIPMGSRLRVGPLLRAVSSVYRVSAVFLKTIDSPIEIRGKNSWTYDVPLLDGTIPILGNLNIETTASNIYLR